MLAMRISDLTTEDNRTVFLLFALSEVFLWVPAIGGMVIVGLEVRGYRVYVRVGE